MSLVEPHQDHLGNSLTELAVGCRRQLYQYYYGSEVIGFGASELMQFD